MYQIPSIEVITDEHGDLIENADVTEPEPGSVALTQGPWGTAWQRHFDDGLWHRTGGGRPRTWLWLLAQRNLCAAYRAPARGESALQQSFTRARSI